MAGVAGRSGRKPKAEKFARPIAAAEKRIADHLPELIDLQFELARGVTVREFTLDGEPKVYTKAPDRQAIEYLANRIMGKPTERIEATSEQTVNIIGYRITPPNGTGEPDPDRGD